MGQLNQPSKKEETGQRSQGFNLLVLWPLLGNVRASGLKDMLRPSLPRSIPWEVVKDASEQLEFYVKTKSSENKTKN